MMNCLECEWHDKSADVRRDHCIACSKKYTGNAKVRWGTNELSNKGQTIESLDNHADMQDDRDIVSEMSREFVASRSGNKATDMEEALAISRRTGVAVSAVGLEYVRRFVYEFSSLSDQQLCLLKALVLGVKKTEFCEQHGMTPSAVNRIYQIMIERSPIIRNFILLTNGKLEGTRGRKRTKERVQPKNPRKNKKVVFVGITQPVWAFAD